MDLTIGVVGATGGIGREILAVLHRTTWRPDRIVPVASPGTSVSFVEYGDKQIAVEELAHTDYPELDALIVAAPMEVGKQCVESAIKHGVPVIDCSGFLDGSEMGPLVIPWVNPEGLERVGEEAAVAVPSGVSVLLTTILGPLFRAGIRGEVQATAFVPASSFGKAGMDELSKQVVALFNSSTPPRKTFENGLAFDLLPILGEANPEGWAPMEEECVRQVHKMFGEGIPLGVTCVGVPVFSGISANIHIRTVDKIDPQSIARVLSEGGVKVGKDNSFRSVPRPRTVEGNPFVHAGRIRTDETGTHLHLWVSMDNLKATATVAVGCCAALLREEIEDSRSTE